MSQTCPVLRSLAVLSASALAACGGGGGTYGSAPSSAIISGSATPVSSGSMVSTTATPASSDSSPAGPQFASVAGPSFNGPNYPPVNTGFGGTISNTLKQGSSITSQQDGTVTVLTAGEHFTSFHVVIPSIGMDQVFSANTDPRGFAGDTQFWGLNYVALGEWANWSTGRTTGITQSLFGYQTPVNAMPTSGAAQFSGWASGTVFKGTDTGFYVDGTASVSVDFASWKVSGALTNMTASRITGGTAWNDVSLSGTIAAGTNTFSGTTAVTSVPNSLFSLSGAATGKLQGGFFGPGAENIGALWTLTDAMGSAVGGLLAKR